jgi:hypothetical protein
LEFVTQSFAECDIALAAGLFEGSADFFVPPEFFGRFRLADGVGRSEKIAEDANAIGVREVGGECDLRGKPLPFTTLALAHNDIITRAEVMSKDCPTKQPPRTESLRGVGACGSDVSQAGDVEVMGANLLA